MKFFLLISALAILFFAGCATTPHAMNTTLQGKWQCVSAISDGTPVSEETVQALRLTLTQNGYKSEKGSEVLFDSTYTIDSTKSPGHIAMMGNEGDLTGKEALGIYSLEGDVLRICYTMPGGKRPESFESKAGSKVFLLVWKRQK